jgi:hypothetical protein
MPRRYDPRVVHRHSELKRGKWSAAELLQLRERYASVGEDRLARQLRRSVESVRVTAERIFSSAARRKGSWTGDDLWQLKLLVGAHPVERIALVLRRTSADVQEQIERLRASQRVRPWNRTDLSLLKRLYGSRRDEDLAIALARPEVSIRAKAEELCLRKDKAFLRRMAESGHRTSMPRWTKEDLAALRALYPDRGNVEIAKILGRSVKSVVSKAHGLGLRKSDVRLREMGKANIALRYSGRR